MKDLNKIYFGESGITSTSAAHVCNLAAERRRVLEYEVNGVNFVSKSVTLAITGGDPIELEKSIDNAVLADTVLKLEVMGDLDALQAWLKEAIKAREDEDKAIRMMGYDTWKAIYGIEEEEEPEFDSGLTCSGKPTVLTTDDILSRWGIKDRNRLYELKSRAAIYGKYIGKDGSFTNARNEMLECMQSPVQVEGKGQDMAIYRYDAPLSKGVETVLESMQKRYRELNKELNGLMFRLESETEQENQRLRKEYQLALADYKAKYDIAFGKYEFIHEAWIVRHRELQAKHEEWRQQQRDAIRALKIVIPNDLKATYDSLTK